MRVEESERLARFDRLDPERGLAQLDRERIAVHAVDAVLHDLAQGTPASLLVRNFALYIEPRHLDGETPRRGEKEVARAASRIDDVEGEKRPAWVLRMFGKGVVDDRLERALDELG